MYRTITLLSLQKWAYDVAPQYGKSVNELMASRSEEVTYRLRNVLQEVLLDVNLYYPNIYNNIDVTFDERWGLRVIADTNSCPYIEYLDKGYGPFCLIPTLFNSKLKKRTAKTGSHAGQEYVNVPIKQSGGEVDFRRLYESGNKSSWIHPGYEGKHFLDRTIDRGSRVVKRELSNSLSEMFGS
jgi:hypothetical protein